MKIHKQLPKVDFTLEEVEELYSLVKNITLSKKLLSKLKRVLKYKEDQQVLNFFIAEEGEYNINLNDLLSNRTFSTREKAKAYLKLQQEKDPYNEETGGGGGWDGLYVKRIKKVKRY